MNIHKKGNGVRAAEGGSGWVVVLERGDRGGSNGVKISTTK
jgi:hypothetical protein